MTKNSWGFGVAPFVWMGEALFHRFFGAPGLSGMKP
jgi:hypothetical protein